MTKLDLIFLVLVYLGFGQVMLALAVIELSKELRKLTEKTQ